MFDDLSDYQSAETAWRYDVQLEDAKVRWEKAGIELRAASEALVNLQFHPPMYHLFNWSA